MMFARAALKSKKTNGFNIKYQPIVCLQLFEVYVGKFSLKVRNMKSWQSSKNLAGEGTHGRFSIALTNEINSEV